MKDDKKYKDLKGETLYKELIVKRTAYLDRARDAALLTLPQLFPPEGSDFNTKYPTPYQSLGAKGVNNLANKVILSLFPPSTAFFKLGLNPADMAALGKSEGQVKSAMYMLETSIVNEMEVSALRPKLVHMIKQLIVGGSCVIYVPNEGSPELFGLSEFGVQRDKKGNVLRLAIEQKVAYPSLSVEIQNQIPKQDLSDDLLAGKKMMNMYTCIIKTSDTMYMVWQEIFGVRINGSEGTYLAEDLPYKFVPFVDNSEDFGRSYCEDFIGDLGAYEGLRQALLEGAAESARILYVVKPNSTISVKALKKARSGDVLLGNPDDVGTIQSDKRLDMSVTQKEADILKQDLAITFLLDSAVRRDAERVTAAEIRQVSQELEISLGGIYSTLSTVLQGPLVRLYMNRLVKQGKMNDVLKGALKLEITTGSAALGRGTDFTVLTTFLQTIQGTMGFEQAMQFLNLSETIKRLAYSLDINTASLIKSDEEIAAQNQAAQQQQMEATAMEAAAPEAAKAAFNPQQQQG